MNPLLNNNQRLRIDNHQRGLPIQWDWKPGDKPQDVHLDKVSAKKINGKAVTVKVTLNNDFVPDGPKKCEKGDCEWMSEYEKIIREVKDVFEQDPQIRHRFAKEIAIAISEIGPHKDRRAIRHALNRIGAFFGLDEGVVEDMKMYKRGNALFYLVNGERKYVGFGNDYSFYLGTGNGADFSRCVKGWRKYPNIDEDILINIHDSNSNQ